MGTIYTREITQYMQAKLHDDSVSPPETFDLQTRINCNIAVSVIRMALRNKIATAWDAEDYKSHLTSNISGMRAWVESKLTKKFPPIFKKTRHISEPTIITDNKGRILLCYLPGGLSREIYDFIWTALKECDLPFAYSNSLTNWRAGLRYFRTPAENCVRPGNINVAPAVFMTGHTAPRFKMHISSSLRDQNTATDLWLQRISPASALLGGILGCIHPRQFAAACKSLETLNAHPEHIEGPPERLHSILANWSAPFHGLSAISNRNTPDHRDPNAIEDSLDLLVPLADTNGGIFACDTLGITFDYSPRTVVLLAGKVLRHSATVKGNRVCLAYYSRSKVHERILGDQKIGWATM